MSDKIMDLVQQYGDISMDLGIAYAREKSEEVKRDAHRRSQLFEKIREALYRLQINNVNAE